MSAAQSGADDDFEPALLYRDKPAPIGYIDERHARVGYGDCITPKFTFLPCNEDDDAGVIKLELDLKENMELKRKKQRKKARIQSKEKGWTTTTNLSGHMDFTDLSEVLKFVGESVDPSDAPSRKFKKNGLKNHASRSATNSKPGAKTHKQPRIKQETHITSETPKPATASSLHQLVSLSEPNTEKHHSATSISARSPSGHTSASAEVEDITSSTENTSTTPSTCITLPTHTSHTEGMVETSREQSVPAPIRDIRACTPVRADLAWGRTTPAENSHRPGGVGETHEVHESVSSLPRAREPDIPESTVALPYITPSPQQSKPQQKFCAVEFLDGICNSETPNGVTFGFSDLEVIPGGDQGADTRITTPGNSCVKRKEHAFDLAATTAMLQREWERVRRMAKGSNRVVIWKE